MNELLRILDANFNRAREGLRAVEEAARFILNDCAATGEIKSLRHALAELAGQTPGGPMWLLAGRSAATDVGANSRDVSEMIRVDLEHVVLANFKRIQEAVRVLEEYGKLIGHPGLLKIKTLRFQVYDLEQRLLPRLLESKPRPDYALYAITGSRFSRGRDTVEVMAGAIKGGAGVVQLREKELDGGALVELGHRLRRLTREAGVTFIVNDRVDVALAVDADGVHLGRADLPVPVARQLLGPGKLIGVSALTLEQALKAREDGADYLGVGPVFETGTKEDAGTALGLGLVSRVAKQVGLPQVAIGGIKAENVARVAEAGADGVAVVTALVAAEDVAGAAAELIREFEQGRLRRTANST
ncbi:MAG: thiamine phosphate synthase [Bacillota bacterium]